MAQSSKSKGGIHALTNGGYGAMEKHHMDDLLANIAIDINHLEDILNKVGTASDTMHQRHEFNLLRDQVNEKIFKATKQITQSMIDSDDKSKSNKYELKLQQHSSSLRNIVSKAIKSFQAFKPHQNNINIISIKDDTHRHQLHDEQSPLLSGQQISTFNSIATGFKVVDEEKLLAQEEEAMADIHSDLQDMKQMFENLDHIVNEQEHVVNTLEANVGITHDAISGGKDELLETERKKRRARCNKIILLIALIVVLAIIIVFVWLYDRSK